MHAVMKYTPVCIQRATISFRVSKMLAPIEFILINPKMAFDEGNISRTQSHTGAKLDKSQIIPDKNRSGMEVNK